MDFSINSVAQPMADLAMAIVNRWAEKSLTMYYNREFRSNAGTINTTIDSISFGNGFHNYQGSWIVFHGSVIQKDNNDLAFRVDSVSGDVFRAGEILVSVSQFLASEDFRNRINHSIRLMKAIHDAIAYS